MRLWSTIRFLSTLVGAVDLCSSIKISRFSTMKLQGSKSQFQAVPSPMTRRSALTSLSVIGTVATLVQSPAVCSAAFGPAYGAVRSQAPVRYFSMDDVVSELKISGGKIADIVGEGLPLDGIIALQFEAEERILVLSQRLDDLGLSNAKDAIEDYFAQKELLKAELEEQRRINEYLAKRAEIIAKVNAQPEWFNYLAAFGASVVSVLVMHPVDTIKTRIITASTNTQSEPPLDTAAGRQSREAETARGGGGGSNSGMLGLGSLYKGVGGNILKEGPSSALYLGVYEAVKVRLLTVPQLASTPLFVYLIAGFIGEVCGSIFRAPAEALKSSVQSGIDNSTVASALRVFGSAEGRGNIYLAWVASLWRDPPMGAVQIAIFEALKIMSEDYVTVDVNSLQVEALLGSIGGAVGAFLSTPPDVIVTRIITQDLTTSDKPLGFLDMGGLILSEGGVPELFCGWKERVAYWGPAIGIFLAAYCWIREFSAIRGIV